MNIALPTTPACQIRNFAIIAHVDHGKSTLSDRLIEATSALDARDMRDQVLDTMDLERERGITIKLQTVRMLHTAVDGLTYQLNLIDTPGHVDFSGEVVRSLAATDGVILLVDATQGVQAQTVANLRLARQLALPVLPVINKIDSPLADLDRTLSQMADLVGVEVDSAVLVSARSGQGVPELLEAIVSELPAPSGESGGLLRALVFDSHYDSFKGVVLHVRVVDGVIKTGQSMHALSTRAAITPIEVGIFSPVANETGILHAGEVGFVSASIKSASLVRPGETLVAPSAIDPRPVITLPDVSPMVFAGLFSTGDDDGSSLRQALERLVLNDAALHFEPEVSNALGAGFRCGFLGLLHMEIVRERLHREHGIDVVATSPTVPYRVHLVNGKVIDIDNPLSLPGPQAVRSIEEMFVIARIHAPNDNVGALMELCQRRRGEFVNLETTQDGLVRIEYRMPLSETIVDLFAELKSLTAGYATVDFERDGYRIADLVKVDILVDTTPVDAFAFIAHRDAAFDRSKNMITKLKHTLPRRLYPIPLQAVVEGKVIGRADLPPIRKSALAKGFEGSASAKKRLAERQRNSRTRSQGSSLTKSDIPAEVFQAILGL